MKPPVLDYVRVRDVDEALGVLAEQGDEAKPLAGGQSLVPMLNLRIARPAVLVDVKELDLRGIEQRDGALRLGALVCHRTLERDPLVAEAAPLLRRVAPSIGHPAIRNRGTLGGSLVHAEPTAELLLAAVALDARIEAASTRGTREIAADAFATGPYMPSLAPDELVVGVSVPVAHPGERIGFAEIAQRSGDFALAAAACRIAVHEGTIVEARVAVAGVSATPARAAAAEEALLGQTPGETVVAAAADAAATGLQARADAHASAEFRRSLVTMMVARALREACGLPEPEEER